MRRNQHPHFIYGTTTELNERDFPLEEHEIAIDTVTGEQRLGPGMYATLGSPLNTLGAHAVVRVATTANINLATGLNAGDVIDGVTLVAGDLVLAKNQTFAHDNGIYVVGGSPARATGFTTYASLSQKLVYVAAGSVGAGLYYRSTAVGNTLGTDALPYALALNKYLNLGAALELSDLPAGSMHADMVFLAQRPTDGMLVKVLASDAKVFFEA